MKLWLLEKREEAQWDTAQGFVIRAETEEDARATALKFDAPCKAWVESGSTCVELTADGVEGIVICDFKSG